MPMQTSIKNLAFLYGRCASLWSRLLATVYYKPKRTLETYVGFGMKHQTEKCHAADSGDLPHDIITTEKTQSSLEYQLPAYP